MGRADTANKQVYDAFKKYLTKRNIVNDYKVIAVLYQDDNKVCNYMCYEGLPTNLMIAMLVSIRDRKPLNLDPQYDNLFKSVDEFYEDIKESGNDDFIFAWIGKADSHPENSLEIFHIIDRAKLDSIIHGLITNNLN